MHIHFLDPYRPIGSPIHRLDARVKLLLTLGFVLACSVTRFGSWPLYVLLFAIVISAEILSGLGPVYVMKRSALALPFALAALPLVFSTEGQHLFSVSAGAVAVTASAEGLSRFLSILLKSWFSVQAAIVLAASTPFPQLLEAMRAVGTPQLLVGMFGLMWRYLFVLLDEALRLTRARAARSSWLEQGRSGHGGSVLWRARVTGGMAGNLLVRAFERSERIYSAMLARGYDGEIRSLAPTPMHFSEWLTLVLGLLVLALLTVLGAATGA